MPEPHIPTIFFMVVISCLSLAVAIGLSGRRGDGDGDGEGVRIWAAALCVHALGYGFFLMRGAAPDLLTVVGANVTISVSITMLAWAIGRFTGSRVPLWLLISPPLVMGAALWLSLDDMRGRIIVSNGILFAQILVAAWALRRGRTDEAPRGRAVLRFSLLISLCVTGVRAATGVSMPDLTSSLFQPSAVQTLTFVLSHMSIILTTGGFVMMAKERSDERLRSLARRDRLTGCWNRVRVEEIAEQEMARLARYAHPVSLLMIDLDHFKDINDGFGHGTGDDVLRAFAGVAGRLLRSTDVLGRWGGEEFVTILPSTGFVEASRVAERIRAAIEEWVFSGGLHVTVSIGVSVCRSTDTWADWLERADAALYRAKEEGRNRVLAEPMGSWAEARSDEGVPFLRLIWRAEFECGDSRIDAPHRALFEGVNDLLLSGLDDRDRNGAGVSLAPLLERLRSHFEEEDEILRDTGYDLAERHAAEHAILLERVSSMLARFETGEIGAKELINFTVFELVSQHMLIEDQRFFPHLAEARGEAADESAGSA